MLKAVPKGEPNRPEKLAEGEDEKLRHAFSRFYGGSEARKAAVAVVAKYQQQGSGRWFMCDCRPGSKRPPMLAPAAERHVVRLTDWDAHDENCDFSIGSNEQRLITDSFIRPRNQPDGLRLVRPFPNAAAGEPQEPREPRYASINERRPALATLLASIITDSGLQNVDFDDERPNLAAQFRAIRNAAKNQLLDKGISVSDALCTYLPAYDEFLESLANSKLKWSPSVRPHGIVIFPITGIETGALIAPGTPEKPATAEKPGVPAVPPRRLEVRGRIAVFGEPDGDNRPPRVASEDDARSPYLAIGVVGQATAGGAFELLRAYAHPCWSRRNLMLVDSNFERETIKQIRSIGGWMAENLKIQLSFEKRLFDIGPPLQIDENAEAAMADGAEDRPPSRRICIPDFIVSAIGPNIRGAEKVVVETMGFADDGYRSRKERTHTLMSTYLNEAPVIEHDFHKPKEKSQEERDRKFRTALRWAITGPDKKS